MQVLTHFFPEYNSLFKTRYSKAYMAVCEMDKKIEDFALSSNSPIFSISGISISGTSILSQIADIALFSQYSKLIGFVSVDPAIYQCILAVCTHNPTFKTYYTRKLIKVNPIIVLT